MKVRAPRGMPISIPSRKDFEMVDGRLVEDVEVDETVEELKTLVEAYTAPYFEVEVVEREAALDGGDLTGDVGVEVESRSALVR